MSSLQALSVVSELFPVIKTGGLADVAGALPGALRPHGVQMRSLLPGYPVALEKLEDPRLLWHEQGFFGGDARILSGTHAGLDLFVLDAPHLFARPGNPYTAPDGGDWGDNAQRFAALSYAAAIIAQGAAPGYAPDVVHAHDWQTGLTAAYLSLSGRARPATVFTLHNLAFQGQVPAYLLDELRLPPSAYSIDGLEYYGAIGMLKAGLRYSDRVTAVSPTYAAEICTPEDGMGMDGVLRARGSALSGILNGIDTTVWDPMTDPALPAPYSAADLAPRALSKAALQARFGLEPSSTTLLFGVVTRLSHQKGLDMLLECLPALLETGAQMVVIGSGDPGLRDGFARAAAENPGRIGTEFGYDEALAHLLQAGSDAVLVPSRFEPCGLTQLCALRYGAVPIVSRVGGLADTVIDANEAALLAGVATGLQFSPVTAQALAGAIARAAMLWRNPLVWKTMQLRGMRSDFSWDQPARHYAALYREAIAGR
jgi:starch synthase